MLFRRLLAVTLSAACGLLASPVRADVFINELHYDDSSTPNDVGERIEIVATAGEDLSTYSIVLYNGSNSAVYDTDAVPAGSNVTCGGTVRIAVVTYDGGATSQLQNGAPDGIALVNGSGVAVQFLSYEGAFTGSGGPAAGIPSTAIPVSETNSTAAGTSLQLNGTGDAYAEFTWSASATDTFGACNTSQTFNNGPPVNTPPSVTTTVPANNGSVLPGTQSFTVNFSESVTAQDTAFAMQCSTTGTVSLTLPGAPKQRTQANRGSLRLVTINGVNITAAATGSSIALATTANLQNGETCTLTVDADGIADSEGAHPTADTTVNFSVTQPPNVLPTVTSTVPANNGSVLPGTTAFTVNFSESVTAQDTAFTMQCSTAGSVPLTLPAPKRLALASSTNARVTPQRPTHGDHTTGKAFAVGTSVTLTTTANLQNGETCTFTIDADGITDAENAHPVADTIVNFSVAPPPNVLPTVAASTPANNAVGVAAASDFRITFSEMVTADSESFVLQCSQSGLIAPLSQYKVFETTPSGGRVITLSSRTVLQAGETCNLTVLAIGVVDDSGDDMAQDHVIHFTVAGGSLSYYNQVNSSSAEQLRCSLHEIINGHTAYPYSAGTTDTWDILEIADEDPNNSGRILDVYKNRSFNKVSDRAGTGSGVTYNREHTWPNSLGFPGGTPGAYTDTHMLYLSDTGYNSDRGNSPYVDCDACTERPTEVNNGFGGGTGTYPGNSNWFDANGFQTWNHRKGDVARAVMYMAIRYEGTSGEPDLELTDNLALVVGTTSSPAYMGKLSTLLAWHAADPPDAAEVARNQVIQSFQGNRNPFIDHPEWASNALFTSSKPTSCQLAN